MDHGTLPVLAVSVLLGILIWLNQRRHRNTVRQQRGAMWDRCLELLVQPEVLQDDVGFPLLKGSYSGRRVTLEPIVDHVAFRKLPQLWVRITVLAKLPVGGTIDYLVRPQNTEFYSIAWSLPVTVPVPEAWPQYALLRTDVAEPEPLIDQLSRHMELFDDPKAKELVITPNGVRMVYQLDEGQRAHYAVLRSPQFDELQVKPEIVEMLLGQILLIVTDLEQVNVT